MMTSIYLLILIHLPVLTFSKFIAKTTCVVDYESFNEIKFSYKFNVIIFDNSTSEYLVNCTQWNILSVESKASYDNYFCNPWQPGKSHYACHLISNNASTEQLALGTANVTAGKNLD